MNKKFLVTAMSLVLAGGMGLANADVVLYGQLDVSIDSTDVDGGEDDINMGSNRSAVGVKGKEDLGGGLKAVYKVEWQVDIDDSEQGPGTNEDDTEGRNNSEFKGRDMFVGLKGNFGRVLFGSMSTAYKSPASKLDPFYRTRNQSRNIGLQSGLHKGRGEEGQGRATNTIRYDSPSLSGFKLAATYTLDNNKSDANDDDPYSLGVTYKGGNLYGFASYLTTQAGDDDSVFQIGAKYKMGDAAVWGMYEVDDGRISGTTGTDKGADIFNLGGSYKIGNNLVSFDYAEGSESDNNTVPEYTTWRIGGKHMFSKRTMVYLTHSNQDIDGAGEIDITSLGLRIKF
ncbi:Outer membrane protein (porin) [hydrothermal vent metagenome]|uniref:Outer membrane protein (Porin) n=1 Tax=hydrothermal vent metagenome TaxID=652676 RepID=A0A3B0YYT2_9ZZZZ